MNDIPQIKDNPDGLHRRYSITKNNGEPIDPYAVHFVLRLDSGGRDWTHIEACRAAADAYIDSVRNQVDSDHLWQVVAELEELLDKLRQETHRA